MATQPAVKRPSRPTIDTVTGNVGSRTSVIGESDVTGDPRPVLSGHGDVGSIIHVRAEGREVGTVEVGADGTWRYQLPQPLSDGLCRLSVQAGNSAGLSVPSKAYTIEVEAAATTPPSSIIDHGASNIPTTAHAVVDKAGRDSGASHNDWQTNDGTAGRLISGHIEGSLGADDRVQVSTDGGRTWQDALMKSNDKWVAIDPNSHTSNWTIQTRVVGSAGKLGKADDSTVVTLKTSTAMPTSVSFDGNGGMMTVKFSPGQVAPGHKLSLIIDGRLYEHALSESNLATGMVRFNAPVIGAKQVSAALVDPAGNISSYRDDRGAMLNAPTEQALTGTISRYGGKGNTVFTVADVGYFASDRAGAHGGAGIDTLKLTGANQVLDVMALNNGAADKLSGIEVIDLTGSGNNTLRMSMADVLNLGHPNAFRQDGYSQMRVTGNAGDRVELVGMPDLAGGSWASAGNVVLDGAQYVVYRNDALKAELFVRNGVAVNVGASIVPEPAEPGDPDLNLPSRPTIDTVTDNVEPHTGTIGQSGLTNDPRPVLSGHGDVGSTIHIRVDSNEVGTTRVGPNGTWTYRLPQPLPDGLARLSVRASNADGQSAPSDAYIIEVDVTPPPPPVIDQASSGTPATLSGHAEPYSTIDVYDGTTFLGTATTNADSQWTFPLPSGMAAGHHALTATARDPAGNLSQSSSRFDYAVGPDQPTAHAVVDDAGRDSGEYHNDWLTNDGTAGRLIEGHIQGVLNEGDRVQVSTDGGRTWQDALMKSNGRWVAVDPNAHTSNWAIQTRVVNTAGKPGEQDSTAVTLKTSTATPTDVSFDANAGTVTVKFSPEQVAPDWKLSLMIDGRLSEHTLSASELASGTATFTAPVQGAKQVVAAMVDTAGNISMYRGVESYASQGTISEDFESLSRDFYLPRKGNMASTQYFDVTTIDALCGVWKQGLLTGRAVTSYPAAVIAEAPTSRALSITGRVRLDLHEGLSATRMSFDLGDMTTCEVVRLYFYDKNGSLIYTSRGYTARGGVHQKVDIDVGKEFTRVEINEEWRSTGCGMNWVDNIVFTGYFDTGFRPVFLNPPTLQALTGDMAYYGGSADTVFTVANVGYFSSAGAGAHGGVGTDTLQLTGANQVLDITALNSGATDKISGIEVIDLTGSGNNTLRVSTADVLNLGHPNVFRQDGYSQVRVTGNAGDRVELAGIPDLADGGWVGAGNFVIGGAQYIVYRNDALKAELFVRDGVAVSGGSSVAPMVPVIDSVVLNAFPSVSGHAGAQAQVTVYDGNISIGTVTAGTDGLWTLALPGNLQQGMHTLTARVPDGHGGTLTSPDFTFDYGGTISRPMRSLAALFGGIDYDASDEVSHIDQGTDGHTPKLTLADVLNPGHQELFRAGGSAQVPGMQELASGSNGVQPVGYTGSYHAAQDADLMMQQAMAMA
ncbi:Ig-like domain-containing protein [Burkholderia sp. 22PA0106]|uniref:Ig-like domain-containing protein n=1 Tax=Burkholderia sp. 22PA0106 TaxID=3237371 RepID=UPI0039C45B2F